MELQRCSCTPHRLHFRKKYFLLVAQSHKSVSRPSTALHVCHCSCYARHRETVHPGAGCLGHRGQGCSVSMVNIYTPCTFFSHHLSPSQRNYTIGDRKLLAVKLAFEEWCHLLESSSIPFVVRTDHHNLEYLRSTKRLNPCQARWSLLFL